MTSLADEPLRLGLFGHKIAYSWSPKLHPLALQNIGVTADYQLFDFEPETSDEVFRKTLSSLDGANITTPYKSRALLWVDQLEDAARTIGAINTLYKEGSKWVGANTDVNGLDHMFAPHRDRLNRGVLILGAGGAALTVKFVLHALGVSDVVLASRSDPAIASWQNVSELLNGTTPIHQAVVINASPIAKTDPAMLKSLIERWTKETHGERLWFDLSYRNGALGHRSFLEAQETFFVDGAEMLAVQAAYSAGRFLGRAAPVGVYLDALTCAELGLTKS